MIGNVLTFIAEDLNTYIIRIQGLKPDTQKVILSTLINLDGSPSVKEDNLILLTLVDIRQNFLAHAVPSYPSGSLPKAYAVGQAPVFLDFYLLFSANFTPERTKDALNYITYVIQYFQKKPLFTQQNSPGLPSQTEKLEFNLEQQNFHDKSHMWGMLGAKYMPSVLYKMRMLSIDLEEARDFIPPITEVNKSD